MELPNQEGNLYCLQYAYYEYIDFYFDSEKFDLNAYKEQLVAAGYTKVSSNEYEKDESKVSFYNNSIEVRYSGTNPNA